MGKIISRLKCIGVPILISTSGLLSIALLAHFLQKGSFSLWMISSYPMVNLTFTIQILALLISFIALGLMYLYNKKSFKKFFRLGLSSSGKNNSWNIYGPTVAAAFTIGTIMLMSAGVIPQKGSVNHSFFALLPLVLLFSLTNAWSEEILSRFVIVAGLDGKLNPVTICWLSGIIFGVAHLQGTPNGLFGVIASGTLGWFLAKSVIETKGLGWALLIHFLQDLVIFGAGAMIIAGQE